jgi:hypothetical protein
VQAIALMDADIHGGTAGVADTAFFASVDRYMRRTSAPAEARAAVDFLHALAAWDYANAVRASHALVGRAAGGDFWLAPDLLRDGATTARLMTGDTAGAREVFVALAPYSQRARTDLRSLVLESMLREASDSTRRVVTVR